MTWGRATNALRAHRHLTRALGGGVDYVQDAKKDLVAKAARTAGLLPGRAVRRMPRVGATRWSLPANLPKIAKKSPNLWRCVRPSEHNLTGLRDYQPLGYRARRNHVTLRQRNNQYAER